MKGYLTLIGYLLFVLGFLSLLLGLLGINLSFLSWINRFGTPASLIIKLSMLFVGIIVMYVSRTNTAEYESE